MSGCCSGGCAPAKPVVDRRYRRILWIALVVNALMFVVELAGGLRGDSAALLADAVDFLGDAGNYAVSLLVLGATLGWRARAAMAKGLTMAAYGGFVLAKVAWDSATGSVPAPAVMGAIGLTALLANGTVALLLYAWRDGDANMRSVWLCTRNDAIGNVAVMLAALGVFGSGSRWPDLVVAAVMGCLALSAARQVIRQARAELRAGAAADTPPASPASITRAR
ncbi:cation transporter [Pseudoduganella sp. FT26W]|uniref:Cation transporter n=1 Tax=Duganella aquatilis TaxID=2666082 RepID=A0A844DAD8_9BURK|nr:cation transporter [Duganella aquatilis]MRW84094.1 cation transporter [Duganella aquatilis]